MISQLLVLVLLILILWRIWKMSTPAVLQPLVDELNALQAVIQQNTAGVAKLSADIQALLAKINAGGSVTAADVQPLVDQAKALEAAVTSSVSDEAAADAAANPPAGGQ
jgi:F0F1-type ATP synthase membrane subunit b/b'